MELLRFEEINIGGLPSGNQDLSVRGKTRGHLRAERMRGEREGENLALRTTFLMGREEASRYAGYRGERPMVIDIEARR